MQAGVACNVMLFCPVGLLWQVGSVIGKLCPTVQDPLLVFLAYLAIRTIELDAIAIEWNVAPRDHY